VTPRPDVAILGAGFCGALLAVHLARAGRAVTLIDRTGRFGPGLAYGGVHPRHYLNTPAGRTSAFPDDPDHFTRWASARDPAVTGGSLATVCGTSVVAVRTTDSRLAGYLGPRCEHLDPKNPCRCAARLGNALEAGLTVWPSGRSALHSQRRGGQAGHCGVAANAKLFPNPRRRGENTSKRLIHPPRLDLLGDLCPKVCHDRHSDWH